MALSENIKKARIKQNFSQEYVAERMGVSRQAVSKWETGQADPSTHNLLQLAELLKVDANILLNESKERKRFVKENIEQKGLRTILNKRNAIFLITSCVSQMFIFGLSNGNDTTLKYIFMGCSFTFIMLLLCNMWFKTDKASRAKLITRVFLFTIAFNLLIILVSRFLGGIMVFVVGLILICTLIKIKYPEAIQNTSE